MKCREGSWGICNELTSNVPVPKGGAAVLSMECTYEILCMSFSRMDTPDLHSVQVPHRDGVSELLRTAIHAAPSSQG
jgi:hypothetical protein